MSTTLLKSASVGRAGREHEVMKLIPGQIALLALVVSVAPVVAGEQAAVVHNCTCCHGTGAQGYMIAPRLAGQRPLYLLNQIRDFREHTRDNPFSRQYIWGAVAALGPQAARGLADYFATIPPKPANDGDRELAENSM